MNFRRGLMLVLLAVVAGSTAQAQWVMVARAASGRIQRMEQQRTANDSGYDVASVILEAKADKVYDTALNALQGTCGQGYGNQQRCQKDDGQVHRRQADGQPSGHIAWTQGDTIDDRVECFGKRSERHVDCFGRGVEGLQGDERDLYRGAVSLWQAGVLGLGSRR